MPVHVNYVDYLEGIYNIDIGINRSKLDVQGGIEHTPCLVLDET